MLKVFLRFSSAIALLLLFFLTTAATTAETPARTQTLAVGPYIIDFNLYQDPPATDTPFKVTVVPHATHLLLQGSVTAEPGLGTDATPIHFPLTATGEANGSLQSTMHMPVRGAWNIAIDLSGPQGQGNAQVAVTVAAPGAIPTWLGWLIGASPLVLVAFWVWRQHRYKQTLLAKTSTVAQSG